MFLVQQCNVTVKCKRGFRGCISIWESLRNRLLTKDKQLNYEHGGWWISFSQLAKQVEKQAFRCSVLPLKSHSDSMRYITSGSRCANISCMPFRIPSFSEPDRRMLDGKFSAIALSISPGPRPVLWSKLPPSGVQPGILAGLWSGFFLRGIPLSKFRRQFVPFMCYKQPTTSPRSTIRWRGSKYMILGSKLQLLKVTTSAQHHQRWIYQRKTTPAASRAHNPEMK